MTDLPPIESAVQLEAADTTERDVLDSTDAAKTAVRGSVTRTTAYMVGSLASALVLSFLVRYLGVIKTGRYVTVVSLATILAGLVETGLTGVSLREYSRCPTERRDELMRDLIALRMTVLIGAGAIIAAYVLLAGYSSAVLAGLALCSVGVALENLGSSYNVWLAANMKLGWIALTNVARQIVVAGLTLVFVFQRTSIVWFFAAFIPGGLAQAAIAGWAVYRRSPLLPSLRLRRWLPLLTSSVPYVLAMGLGFVYFRIPVVMLSLIGEASAAGYFGAAFRITETLTLMTIVLTAVVPILTRSAGRNHERHRYGLRRMVEVSIALGGFLSAGVFSGAELGIRLLAGRAFTPSVGVLQLLAPLLLLKFLTTAWSFGLLSLGAYREVLGANLLAVAFNICICLVLIPLAGRYGAAVASVATEGVVAMLYGLALLKRMGRAVFPRRVGTVTLLSLVVSGSSALLPISYIALPFVAGALFLLLMRMGDAIPAEALQAVPGVCGLLAARKSNTHTSQS